MNGEGSSLALAKFLLPKMPGMLSAAFWHSLGLSPTSSKWDLQTVLSVAVLRQALFNSGNQTLGQTQRQTLIDTGAKGKLWTAPATIPSNTGHGVRELIFDTIAALGDGSETYTKPDNADVRVEWTGFRSTASSATDPLPTGLSPKERYDALMSDPTRTSDMTILYFHGGAYYLCGFATHRLALSRLARSSSARCLAVEYRLAPQSAFPAQLIDALNAYLYLLYPPEGSLHAAVPADKIVFAGDSAGGHLAFCLLQLLLALHRSKAVPTRSPTVTYNGTKVELPLPAGVSGMSPWFDISRSSPSLWSNAKWDYLPVPDEKQHLNEDEIWPASPPRGDVFVDLSLMAHPLVSLMTADWTGAPPMWMTYGDEQLFDEGAVVARRARAQGVVVQWEHYEAMPHCWSQLHMHLPTARQNYDNWGKFCKDVTGQGEGKVVEKSIWVEARTGKVKDIILEQETTLTFDQAVENVKASTAKRIAGFGEKAPVLVQPKI